MKSKFLFGLVAIVAVIVIIILSLPPETSGEDYRKALEAERLDKDDYMKSSEESPFGSDTTAFHGLKYFAPDTKFKVKAKLTRVKQPRVVVLPTSSGEEDRYLEYGWAEFELSGMQNRLLLLEVMAMGPTRGRLFLAFADETSARETYGAGRYLDVKKVAGANNVELDFNRAYNPYCAYNDRYSCPLPPSENILKIAVIAGEKSYHATP